MDSDKTPPPGWDEPDPGLTEAAQGLRKMYLALVSTGFTMMEASCIIGQMITSGNTLGQST
jgi:hypothetical protein